jgi:hypothetical protein
MKAKEFIPAEKPRNFVAKNAKMGGAGQHKDKKKAEKQGDLKHKSKQFEQGMCSCYFVCVFILPLPSTRRCYRWRQGTVP